MTTMKTQMLLHDTDHEQYFEIMKQVQRVLETDHQISSTQFYEPDGDIFNIRFDLPDELTGVVLLIMNDYRWYH